MKSEKRFYCDELGEYRSYAIYDCSKVDKTKEDFWDNVEGVYDIIAYEEYLEENDCMLISNEVEHKLNEQQATISRVEKENEKLRNKLEVANARSGYYQRMLEKWCVK